MLAEPKGAFKCIKSAALGEAVNAFVPHPLPPSNPTLSPEWFALPNREAELALARLSSVSGLVPSVDWLLYGAIRREALLTSQIEATLTDVFDPGAGFAVSNTDDVEERCHQLSARLQACAATTALAKRPADQRAPAVRRPSAAARWRTRRQQAPGKLRRSQNWIGGTRPGNAAFVPPPADRVAGPLAALEKFIHAPKPTLPPLVRIALVHAQFETIHPFLDGNGRLGRLLIGALLEQWGLLAEPLLYLSGYLKQHQAEYYRRLSAIRTEGDWESWIAFFLEGVCVAAADAERSIIAVASLVTTDRRRLLESAKAGPASYRLFELLPMKPRFTVEQARLKLETSFPTANAAVQSGYHRQSRWLVL